ncbi:MAG: hypothetical protein ACK559_15405, partial [bacterium]
AQQRRGGGRRGHLAGPFDVDRRPAPGEAEAGRPVAGGEHVDQRRQAGRARGRRQLAQELAPEADPGRVQAVVLGPGDEHREPPGVAVAARAQAEAGVEQGAVGGGLEAAAGDRELAGGRRAAEGV